MKHLIVVFLIIFVTQNTIVNDKIFLMETVEVDASENAKGLIQRFEGFKPAPYLDAGGIPTIGFGTTVYPSGIKVTLDDTQITLKQAKEYLEHNLNQKCDSINSLIKVPVTQNQFDAVCSFTYNLGVHSLRVSTLLKKLNVSDYSGAADEFLKWKYDNGIVLKGLEERRQAERELFLRGDFDVATK